MTIPNYPAEVYKHLDDRMNGRVLDYDDPDYKLWQAYCLKEGLTAWEPCHGGERYIVTAHGEVAWRQHGGKEPADEPTHSEDFRSVRWCGTDYEFTPMQAAFVGILWQAWENKTPTVGEEGLIDRAGSSGSSVRDVFKQKAGMHPAWSKMITSPRKGAYCLTTPK